METKEVTIEEHKKNFIWTTRCCIGFFAYGVMLGMFLGWLMSH